MCFFVSLITIAICAAVIWWVLYFDPKAIERRCLARAQDAEELLDENDVAGARRLCLKARAELEQLARRTRKYRGQGPVVFPDGSRATAALATVDACLAVISYRQGLPDAAEKCLGRIRERFGATQVGVQWLFRYYYRTGHVCEEAIKCYRHALTTGLGGEAAEVRPKVSRLFRDACQVQPGMSDRELGDRIKWNVFGQQFFPQESWPWLGDGEARYRLGEFENAKQLFSNAARHFPKCLEAQMWYARVLGKLDDRPRARQLLVNVAKQALHEPAILAGVAEGLAGIGCMKEASVVLKKIPTEDPKLQSMLHFTKGRILLHAEKLDKAVAQLSHAYKLAPHDTQLVMVLAEAHRRGGAHEAALEVLRRSIPEETRSPQEQLAMGSALWNCGRFQEALSWFQRASHHAYRPGESRLYAGRCLLRLGRFSDAAETLKPRRGLTQAERARAFFYRGVALSRDQQPGRALRQFIQAYTLAKEQNNRALARLAGQDALVCYNESARQYIGNREYAQAAKALELLRANLTKDRQRAGRVENCIVNCHVHAAIDYFENGGPHGPRLAIESLRKAVAIDPSTRLRGLLAGFHASQAQFAEAAEVYHEILSDKPGHQAARFARALCHARGPQPQEGYSELSAICQEVSRYSVRAALAVANKHAQDGHCGDAAQVLLRSIRGADPAQESYYGEACCRLVLYTARDDRIKDAKKFAVRLLGGGDEAKADAILGILLAHEGYFDMALPYLATGVPASANSSVAGNVLKGVYQRVAADRCQKREFGEAAKLLKRAGQRFGDANLMQFAELAGMAATSGKGHARVDERTLPLLANIYHSSPTPHPLIARATAVAHQRIARDLAACGRHDEATRYWREADVMWIQRIAQDDQFWADFIESYNVGKQYRLDSTPGELRNRVFQRMATLHMLIMRDALRGCRGIAGGDPKQVEGAPLFDTAAVHWQETQRFVGEQAAAELFDEMVPWVPIAESHDLDGQMHILQWLHGNVGARDKFVFAISNVAYAQAMTALTERDASTFLERLRLSGETDPDFYEEMQNVQRLGSAMISRIVYEASEHPAGPIVRREWGQRDFARYLYISVVVFAVNEMTDEYGNAIGPHHVPIFINDVVDHVIDRMKQQG